MSEQESAKTTEAEPGTEPSEDQANEVSASVDGPKADEPADEGADEKPDAKPGETAPASVSSDEIGPEREEEPEEEEIDPLEQAREENKKLREQMLRVAADFDNFRKRARRDSEDAARRAKIDILRELLPVFDNMERAAAHADQTTDAKAMATGVEMVVKQFLDTLSKLGVERVKSVGEAFDPNIHEAIQQIETADQDPGTVVAEMLPGYHWGERLLRAAMVVVAKAPPEPEPEPNAESAPVEAEDELVEEASDAAGGSSPESEDGSESEEGKGGGNDAGA